MEGLVMRKLSYEEVKEFIEGNGCKLLSTEYKNNSSKLEIRCACGKVFEARFNDFKNGKKQCNECGIRIRTEAIKSRVTFKCEMCNTEKTVKVSAYERAKHHFCCKECQNKWQSIYMVGENNPNFGNGEKIKGEKNYWYGKKMSDEQKRRLSDSKKGKYLGTDNPNHRERYIIKCDWCNEDLEPMTKSEIEAWEHHFCKDKNCRGKWMSEKVKGENHPNYNPNLTDEDRADRRLLTENSDWRNKVYTRDDYTCQCCGQKGGRLNAHHLNGFNWDIKHRTDVNNGVVLCEDCHKEYHKIYGKGNNTIEQFREFLYNKYLKTNDLKYLKTLEDIDIRATLINNLSLVS